MAKAGQMLNSSLFIKFHNNEMLPQQYPRMTNKLFFGMGGSIMNLAIVIYLMFFNQLK